MAQRTNKIPLRRGDILLLAGCLLAALLLGGYMRITRQTGRFVVVEQAGQQIGRYSLKEDRTVSIRGEGGYNLLVIREGEAFLSEADCPTRLCVRRGKIRYVGQSIVCLPHRVVVKITGDGLELDGVTGG